MILGKKKIFKLFIFLYSKNVFFITDLCPKMDLILSLSNILFLSASLKYN